MEKAILEVNPSETDEFETVDAGRIVSRIRRSKVEH
jgi:hypothetical protein